MREIQNKLDFICISEIQPTVETKSQATDKGERKCIFIRIFMYEKVTFSALKVTFRIVKVIFSSLKVTFRNVKVTFSGGWVTNTNFFSINYSF